MMGRLEFNKVTQKLPFTNEKIAVKTNYSFLPDTNDLYSFIPNSYLFYEVLKCEKLEMFSFLRSSFTYFNTQVNH